MRHYFIYLLKPDIAASYFGKEWLVYQLFIERETANKELKEIVKKQINYITEEIPQNSIEERLTKTLQTKARSYVIKDHYYIDLKSFDSKAYLKIDNNMVTITASGSYQAETIFFEELRQIHSCFFAMDIENKNFGWLNPVKQVNYI